MKVKIVSPLLGVIMAVSASASPRDLYRSAVKAYRAQRYAESVRLYTHALEKAGTGNRYFIYNNRGLAWRHLKKPGRAMKDMLTAIRLNPGYAPAYNNIGILYLDRGEYRRALELFNHSHSRDGDYYVAYYNIACVYSLQKKTAAALRFFQQAVHSYKVQHRSLQGIYREILRDPQLNNLRDYPPFQKYFQHMERKLRLRRI